MVKARRTWAQTGMEERLPERDQPPKLASQLDKADDRRTLFSRAKGVGLCNGMHRVLGHYQQAPSCWTIQMQEGVNSASVYSAARQCCVAWNPTLASFHQPSAGHGRMFGRWPSAMHSKQQRKNGSMTETSM